MNEHSLLNNVGNDLIEIKLTDASRLKFEMHRFLCRFKAYLKFVLKVVS